MSMPSAAGTNPSVDVAATGRSLPGVALLFALLAVPGVLFTWDLLPWGGFYTGVPLAIAAIVVGVRARRGAAGGPGTAMATTAIVIGIAALALVAVWSAFELALGTSSRRDRDDNTKQWPDRLVAVGARFRRCVRWVAAGASVLWILESASPICAGRSATPTASSTGPPAGSN